MKAKLMDALGEVLLSIVFTLLTIKEWLKR